MTSMTIANQDEAEAIADQLQGRIEVMEDDGLEDSPDCEDSRSVLELVNAVERFPATVDLSHAEGVQAAIALENLADDPDTKALAEAVAARSDLPGLTPPSALP